MQTFLPFSSFEKSAKCLDNKRLGKQRVEAQQILTTVEQKRSYRKTIKLKKGWWYHPAVNMWQGYEEALRQYMRCIIVEWVNRGFANSIPIPRKKVYEVPPWIGKKAFHDSHKSNLTRKHPGYYNNWKVKSNLPYYWPTKENE